MLLQKPPASEYVNHCSLDRNMFIVSITERGLLFMLGFLFNAKECKELDYLLRKELDEMLFDLSDKKMDKEMKHAIEQRYKVVFRMYARLASPKEISRYARNKMFR